MRAGEASDHETVARRRRRTPAPTIRALGVLAVLVAVLLVATGAANGSGESPAARHGGRVEVLGEQVTRTERAPTSPTSVTTSAPPSTTTTAPPAPVVAPAATPPPVVSAAPDPAPPAVTNTCADALAYLAAHQAPGFTDLCADGSAFGHLGVTCVNHPGMCDGQRIIHIACPAPFVYMNEAHNSWVLIGQGSGIDPYGQGSVADRAACDRHR